MPHALDVSNFRQMLLDSPDQFRVGFDLARDIRVPGTFTSIMISGMGGSALPGNLFRVYLNDLFCAEAPEQRPLGIYQNRFYQLPPESFHQCLHCICSYSGNTEETIVAFEEALAHGLPCIGISSGGAIEALCRKHSVPHIKLPIPFPGFQPRVGTGYFFGALFQVLVNQGLVPDMTETLLVEAEKLKNALPAVEQEGKTLAEKLVHKIPVIYTSAKYKPVAMVWKIKFNENAKTPAFWNFFPELNHNEMVGFTLPQAKFIVVMLSDAEDHPRNLKRFSVTKTLLEEEGIEVETVPLRGESAFEKMFRSLLVADFASYYLALAYEVDPTPVDMVERLKKIL